MDRLFVETVTMKIQNQEKILRHFKLLQLEKNDDPQCDIGRCSVCNVE